MEHSTKEMLKILKKYRRTLFLIIAYSLLVGYPAVVVLLNPIPAKGELIHLRAKILNADSTNYGVTVDLEDGSRQQIYLPTALYLVAAGKQRFAGLSGEQERLLRGCDADIYGKPVYWLLPVRFQVWEIRCQAVFVPFRQIESAYRKDLHVSNWLEVIVLAILFTVLLLIFRNESKAT